MKHYRWDYRKCAKNLGGLLLRLILAAALCIFLGAGPFPG